MLDFRGLVKLLEARGELHRIRRPVDARYEMPALMEQCERQRRAFLFESVKGSHMPVVGGLLNRIECYGWALGVSPGEPFSPDDLGARIDAAKAGPIAPVEVADGPVKAVRQLGAAVDLGTIPAPTVFELDSGPYITAGCGITRNPLTGQLNVGIYRVLVLGPREMLVNASSSSDLRGIYAQADRSGQPLDIALAIGVEPALLMAAVCKLPASDSEYGLAGALMGRALELVRCETSDLLVPAHAEMVVEGRVDFSRKLEHTLGEFAGQYGAEVAPVTVVTAITQRHDAMHYSILAGKNAEHNTLGSIATYSIRRTLAAALRRALPQIHDLHVYLEPGFGSMAHIAISVGADAGIEPMALIDAAFATGFPSPAGELPLSLITKRIVVVDDDVDVHDIADVEWALWTRLARAEKLRVIPEVRSWELERCAKPGTGSLRLAVDATVDREDLDKLRRTVIPGAERVRLADYLDAGPAGV